MDNIRQLNIPNENNKLHCNAFVHVHFAPARPIYESEMGRSYVIEVDGEKQYFILIDMLRFPFIETSCIYTLPAFGLMAEVWRKQFREKYPETNDDTEMAAYMYLKAPKPLP